jgi:acetoin utilization deacetylase AcuC-like enzyme
MNKHPQPALLYSAEFARAYTGEISFEGDDLVHHVGGLALVDPIFTVSKLQYPYPLPASVPYPEQSLRITTCYEALLGFGLIGPDPNRSENQFVNQFKLYEPRPAAPDELAGVHSAEYIEKVQKLSRTGGELAGATYIGTGAFEAAQLAAGAAIRAVELLAAGETNSALVLSRPPGHHASRESGGGFCLFNNAALAAVAARSFGWGKALIIDWDLHHGDGTQAIFEEDAATVYLSLHQFGPELYPESGDFHETGRGDGAGCSVNLPLPAKTGDPTYLALFKRVVPELVAQFRPDLIIVSAGFDGHFNDTIHPYVWDPGGGLSLSAQLYHTLTGLVKECARQSCEGRYLVILEGGYNLYNLPAGLVNTAAAMLDRPALVTETIPANVPAVSFDTEEYLARLRAHHTHFRF